jgi:hypothetical protein
VNDSHTHESCWKINIGSGGPVDKGRRFIIYHEGSDDGGLFPKIKLIFQSKSGSDIDYHGGKKTPDYRSIKSAGFEVLTAVVIITSMVFL